MVFAPAIHSIGSSYPSVTDASTNAWIQAVYNAGGRVSQTRAGVVQTLISSLKTNTIYNTKWDRLWILGFADESPIQAQIDIVNRKAWTKVGTGTLGSGGWTGDGSTGYLDSNFNPATAGGNWAADGSSLAMAVYNRSTSGFNTQWIAAYAGAGNVAVLFYMSAAGPSGVVTAYESVSDAGSPSNSTNSLTNQQGRFVATRDGSAGGSAQIYKNGSTILSSGGSASTTTPSLNLYIGAKNNGSGADSFSPDQLAMAGIGGGLSGAQAANFDSAIAACMTSLGI